MNDAVDWAIDLGGGVRVALIQAGTFRSDAGTLFGPVPWVLWDGLVDDEVDDKRRLLQALNCLLIETKSGRVLVETGHRRPGRRQDPRDARLRGPLDRAGAGGRRVPARRAINAVAMSHLHFDHAGGLLRADGDKAFPHAKIVAQQAEWEVALGDNPRLVASYVQPELRLVETWGKQGWVDGEHEIMPERHGRPDRRPLDRPPGGHRPGTGDGARTLAFFGDLMMRPWAANPRWVTAFDDFPLDSVTRKASCSRRPPRRTGSSSCRTRRATRSAGSCATATGSHSRLSRAPESPGCAPG